MCTQQYNKTYDIIIYMLHIIFVAVDVNSSLCDLEEPSEEISYGYGNLTAQVCVNNS